MTITARVTITMDVPEEKFREILSKCRTPGSNGTSDYDLSQEEAEEFLKHGRIADPAEWEDCGYIPDSWLEYCEVNAGLLKYEEVGV